MPSIANTLGVGSGVDTGALIDALVAAERGAKDTALTARSTRVEARISGTAQVKSALDALSSALATRTRNGALGPLPASSDTAIVTARATAGATRTLQPTNIEVRALAAGQALVSAPLASAAATVGQGTLTLTLGTLTPDGSGDFNFAGAAAGIDIDIGAGDDSLTGLAAAINHAQTSVRASVIDDGTGARLVLKGPTGAKSAFILTAGGDPGLDRFVYRPGVAAMTVSASARDAELRVDGVTVTRPSNSIADLLPGTRLDLVKAAPGTSVTIAASRDAGGLAQAVGDLVDALNALHGLTATLTHSGQGSSAAGPLAGDATLRALARELGGLTGAVGGGLAALGVATARDGSLSVDAGKLGRAVAANPDAAEALLAGLTASGGGLARAQATLATGGNDGRLVREQRAVVSERTALDTPMNDLRDQLTRQFAAMERAVNGFKSTGSFLDAQIKAWNRSTN